MTGFDCVTCEDDCTLMRDKGRTRATDKYHAMADALGGAEAMARVLGFAEVEELLGEHRSTCLRIAEHIQAGIREKAGQS